MCVNIRKDEAAIGITPDGKEFSGWHLAGLDSPRREARFVGVCLLKSLRWYGIDGTAAA